MKPFVMRLCIIFGIMIAVSVSVQASITANYGDLSASTVSYLDVSESTDFGMYGTPAGGGDTLSFNPLGLKAAASGGGGQINDVQLNFDIEASAGNFISDLQFDEAGDFTMFGFGTDGNFGLLTDDGGGLSYGDDWSGNVMIDIDSILTDNGIGFVNGATLLNANLDNVLIALSESGTSAQIQNKSLDGFSVTAIPEPATMGLICLFTGGLWFARRFFAA